MLAQVRHLWRAQDEQAGSDRDWSVATIDTTPPARFNVQRPPAAPSTLCDWLALRVGLRDQAKPETFNSGTCVARLLKGLGRNKTVVARSDPAGKFLTRNLCFQNGVSPDEDSGELCNALRVEFWEVWRGYKTLNGQPRFHLKRQGTFFLKKQPAKHTQQKGYSCEVSDITNFEEEVPSRSFFSYAHQLPPALESERQQLLKNGFSEPESDSHRARTLWELPQLKRETAAQLHSKGIIPWACIAAKQFVIEEMESVNGSEEQEEDADSVNGWSEMAPRCREVVDVLLNLQWGWQTREKAHYRFASQLTLMQSHGVIVSEFQILGDPTAEISRKGTGKSSRRQRGRTPLRVSKAAGKNTHQLAAGSKYALSDAGFILDINALVAVHKKLCTDINGSCSTRGWSHRIGRWGDEGDAPLAPCILPLPFDCRKKLSALLQGDSDVQNFVQTAIIDAVFEPNAHPYISSCRKPVIENPDWTGWHLFKESCRLPVVTLIGREENSPTVPVAAFAVSKNFNLIGFLSYVVRT